MPVEAKPLFRPDVLRDHLQRFTLPASIATHRPLLDKWAKMLKSERANRFNEKELLPDFLTDIFCGLLGYARPHDSPERFTFSREKHVEVDGKFADAVLGSFVGDREEFVVAVEGKGPLDPLDRPFKNRKMSAVDQGYRYAINLPCDWVIVTSMRETRLYFKGADQHTFERFVTEDLAANEALLKKFVFLLGADRVVPVVGRSHLYELHSTSEKVGRNLTREFYQFYSLLRHDSFLMLCEQNPNESRHAVLAAAQKLLDRVLFCCFCEDRGLLPLGTVRKAFEHRDPFTPRPIWENFKGLFRSVDVGNEHLDIPPYNGGLFAPDEVLERLKVPDDICRFFLTLSGYDFRSPSVVAADVETESTGHFIDVEILGHIFEQSISDLERIRNELDGLVKPEGKAGHKTRRKQEGAFYTPAFITRYIIEQTLGGVLADRFEALRREHAEAASRTTAKVLEDPRVYDLATLTKPQRKALTEFWHAWQETLGSIRVLDPACGSGAFLIEAFDQLHAAYRVTYLRLDELRGHAELFDIDRQILQSNLYGVDLNEEAIQICRLSLWIKTAQRGKKLTSLDHTIRVGNSVVADPSVHPLAFDWQTEFSEVFQGSHHATSGDLLEPRPSGSGSSVTGNRFLTGAAQRTLKLGGFDVVVGNPPYVRQEWLTPFKSHFEQNFRAYHGMADLYVYFFERGLELLKPGGRLSFVVTNKWMKAGYGEPLRRLLADASWIDSVVDFGHAKQIFEDADVFPSIFVVRRPTDVPKPATVRLCSIPREQLRVDDLSRQIADEGVELPMSQLGSDVWQLEPTGVNELLAKIKERGTALSKFAGVKPLVGIKTGFNDAFLIDQKTKDSLVAHHASSVELLRPYLRGQDYSRWHPDWAGYWMIALASSENREWPWGNAGDGAEAIFRSTYPAIFDHFAQYRDQLQARQDQGRYWWELRSCAYWKAFDGPKLMYPEITWRAEWCFDGAGTLTNNTAYILPYNDLWILAVANAPISWWYSWRTAIHGKDEALRFIKDFVQDLPIPTPSDSQRQSANKMVSRLNEIAQSIRSTGRTLLDWLKVEFAIEKPSQKLQAALTLDSDGLVAEVKKLRGKKQPLSSSGLKALRDEFERSIVPAQRLTAEAATLERQVSDLVNAAYGLTPAEVELMWQTAPPRMPIPKP